MTVEERIAAGERMMISRREALRLGVLVLSAPAVGALLAACRDDGARAGGGGPSPTASPDGEAATITFAGPQGKLKAVYAQATKPTGAVLVIHDNRGLTPDCVALVGRLAQAGVQRVMLQWLDLDDLDGIELFARSVLPQLAGS